jgi:hypothetical protein
MYYMYYADAASRVAGHAVEHGANARRCVRGLNP